MSTTDHGTWRRTSPFAILYFLGRTLQKIAKNAWQSLAPLLALLVAHEGDLVSKLILGGSVFLVFILVASLLNYWFFRFQLIDDSILIRHGVFKKKQLDIKFARIQGVNAKQNPVYRVLGLVTLSFDTAGSAGNEGYLPAVTRDFARSLRERIGRPGTRQGADVEASEAEPLVQLDWRDMIRIGLADRRALLVFAVIGPLMERIEDNFDRYLFDLSEIAAANGIVLDAFSDLSIGITIFFTVILLLVVFSIATAFLRYHNFKLFLDGRTLRSHAGLFTAHEHSMDLGKIQTVRIQQGIVQRLMGRFQMTARQAVSGGRNRNRKIFVVPVVTAELADALRTTFLAPEGGRLSQDPASAGFAPISPFCMRTKILVIGLLPALAATLAFWPVFGVAALLYLLWLPAVAMLSYRNWKRAGFKHDDQEMIYRSGVLGYRTVSLLFRRVQRVTVSQSRYQRRKNLASLRMYMASGNVRVPYIDHDEAKRLRDYILYKVESSQKSWH